MIRYGFDIGGTKIEMAIFDDRMALCFSRRVPTPTRNYGDFLAAVAELMAQGSRQIGPPGSIGLGLPGITDPLSGRQLSSNVPCLTNQRPGPDLRALFACPVHIDNDCRCFTLSEAMTEQTRDLHTVFGIILGTGAGGGLVVNRQLHRGGNGMAGEWGHTPLSAPVALRHQLPVLDCPCGLTGCLERYVSGTGLAALCARRGQPYTDAPALMLAWGEGEPAAREIFDLYVDILASALAGLQTVLDVDAFVLGGGLSKIEELYPALPPAMARWLLPGVRPAAVLRPRHGDASGVRGAALLGGRQTDRL